MEIEKEKAIDGYPKPVTIEGTIKILEQLKNCICKIENKNGKGTGFFCSISEKIKVLITNNHIINEEIIKENEKIQVSINDDKEYKIIELKNKKIYTNKEYDTTIIEINIEKEKIYNYIELDNKIMEKEIININSESIYILQYPNSLYGQKASVSYGIIKKLEDEYNIIHYCCTENGSSGSPIINLLNNKIIGIHKESVKNKNYNRGTLLKYPINEYLKLNNKNEINLTIKINEKDINKNIYYLNYDLYEYNSTKDYKDSIEYYNKLLNESKIEIYINNKKYENKRYFKPKEIGEYKIKLIFNTNITNMSYMFFCCDNLTNINLSSFDTKNVTNMQTMFFECFNLTNINLSSFDTKNVINMNGIFSGCHNLKSVKIGKNMNKILFSKLYKNVNILKNKKNKII